MRNALLLATICMTSLSACAQPAPGYGDQGPPPGYQGAPPPGYSQGSPQPAYGQQGWAGGMQGAGGQNQAPPPPGAYGGSPDGGPPAPPPVPPVGGEGGGGGRGHLAQKFAEANVTHDGRLTQQQAQAAGMHGVARHFAEIDRDQKGYVTLQDLKAWRQERKAEKVAQPQSGPAGATPGYPPPAPPAGYPAQGSGGQGY